MGKLTGEMVGERVGLSVGSRTLGLRVGCIKMDASHQLAN